MLETQEQPTLSLPTINTAIASMHDFTDNDDDDVQNNTPGNGGGNANNSNSGSSNNPFGDFSRLLGMTSSGLGQDESDFDINELAVNYNSKFANADEALFRDGVISQTMSVLIGKNKPNALLVGPAGTGKTRIVEDIARRIANQDATVPPRLAKSTIYEVPLANIVSNSMFRGQLEAKTRAMIDFFEDPDNDAILFIDEIHLLQSRDGSYNNVAQILKPALARGDMRVIGATTLQEANDLASDPAFNRRFNRIIVDELTPEQTVEVMKKARGGLFSHYDNKVIVRDDMLPLIQSIADKYHAPGLHRPDNALSLLDRSCADALMEHIRKGAALKAQDPDLYKQYKMGAKTIMLSEKRIRRTAMLLMTGHASKDNLDIDELTKALSPIKGQTKALDKLKRLIQSRDLELFDDKRPLAVMLAGSSGVGKTEACRIIAQKLTGNEPIMLNMTEYNDAATVNRIIGSPVGYIGSDDHREFPFDILQSNPYQVILLDEIEKAHRSVQRLFMSVLEEGKLKTSRGVELDFSHAIVFATTNAGAGHATTHAIGFSNDSTNNDAMTAASLSAWFDPEFLNRFQAVIQFNDISKEIYREIVADRYATEACRINAERRDIELPEQLDDETLTSIVQESYVPEYGARPALRAVKAHIEDLVLSGKAKPSNQNMLPVQMIDDNPSE